MKLSDLKAEDVTPVSATPTGPSLSSLNPDDVSAVPAQPPQGWGEYLGRAATGAIPIVTGAGAAALASETGPGAIPAAGAGYAAGSELKDAANHYLFGDKPADYSDPMTVAGRVAKNGVIGAANEVGAQALAPLTNPVAKYISGRLENAATSPVLDKVANATNMVGKSKQLISKITDQLGDTIPPSMKATADMASGAAGRAAVYHTPLGAVQGVSDLARAGTMAQKGLASAIDNAPAGTAEALGSAGGFAATDPVSKSLMSTNIWTPGQISRISQSPYHQILKNAGESGGPDGMSTAHYILQQTDPKYQELLKTDQE